ncbi:conserved hypothetical protein [Culex quinquefasciatus]|uniref:Peptidase C19 ubiquitin carboxyl-terminal hydrolase domain-containing protein n=1 Tax=Culex quinquefasciatus TaxID=7176 RepID=B0XFA1_CULQU|nr:conserved hypothetical protein [Culex quinquefasciatus]|eukprot:XP_001868323.1 conserved hypothetical protein [Culex quinquefasciatus]
MLVFKRIRPASCTCFCSCFTTGMGKKEALDAVYVVAEDRRSGCGFAPVVFGGGGPGEEKDPTEEGNDEKRHNRRCSARMLHSVPAVYDHQQHYVPEVMTATPQTLISRRCSFFRMDFDGELATPGRTKCSGTIRSGGGLVEIGLGRLAGLVDGSPLSGTWTARDHVERRLHSGELLRRIWTSGWRDGWLSLEPRVACGLPSGSQGDFRGSIAETAGSAGRLRFLGGGLTQQVFPYVEVHVVLSPGLFGLSDGLAGRFFRCRDHPLDLNRVGPLLVQLENTRNERRNGRKERILSCVGRGRFRNRVGPLSAEARGHVSHVHLARRARTLRDNHGGHYMVYINPKNDGKWCKFDDDVVSRCTRNEAIEQNYGGHDNDLNIRHSSNAYMLVFVCKFTIHEVLEDVKSIDISDELQERLDEQRRTNFMNINVLLEDYTEIYQKSDLFNPATATYRTFKLVLEK